MKRFDVYVRGHKLYFHASEGWTHELMESMLSTGKLFYKDGVWSLSENHGVSCFDEMVLRERVKNIYRGGEQNKTILSLREQEYCLKYYSTVGVFEFGEKANPTDSFGRRGNWY